MSVFHFHLWNYENAESSYFFSLFISPPVPNTFSGKQISIYDPVAVKQKSVLLFLFRTMRFIAFLG